MAIAPYLVVLALCLAVPGSSAASLDDYAQPPSFDELAISPDGARLAYGRTEGVDHIIAVVSFPGRQPLGAFRIGKERLHSIQWLDDHRLLIATSLVYAPLVTTKMSSLAAPHIATPTPQGAGGLGGVAGSGNTGGIASSMLSVGHRVAVKRDWSLLQVYDLNTHVSTPLPDPAKIHTLKMMNVIAGQPMIRQVSGHSIVIVSGIYVTDPGMGDMYDPTNALLPALIRIDLDSGTQTILRQGSRETQQWLTNAGGDVVAELDYAEDTLGRQQRWTLEIQRGKSFDDAASGREPIDLPQLLGMGPLPDTLLVEMDDDADAVWTSLSLKSGAFGAPATEHRGLRDPIVERTTNRILGGMRLQVDARYVFFDPALQAQWDAIVQSVGTAQVRLISASDDFRHLIVRLEGDRYGLRYALVDTATHQIDPIGNVYPGNLQLLPARRIDYPAADGLIIPAFLTLPPGESKNLPLIVLVHGSVSSVETSDFDWWSQALAAQGYAVLRPNFRGSGVDRRFLAAGFGQWGRKMQSDLSDGVRYLAAQGIADPKRVCIVGARYGGYAALNGMTQESGAYRCAVAVSAPSDLGRWQKSIVEKDLPHANPAQRRWNRLLGVADANDAALDRLSPIKHVDAVRAPVMLMHADDDDAVPFEQSQALYDALQRAGKDVVLVPLAHEDELFSGAANRLLMLQRSLEFLRANNPPN